MMVSAGTLHVVSTELTVGAFAMAGLAFLLAGLSSHGLLGLQRHLNLMDHVAHFALAFGLLRDADGRPHGHPSQPWRGYRPSTADQQNVARFGLVWFGLWCVAQPPHTHGVTLWDDTWGSRWQAMGGMAASGLILATASIGGTFSRGESLLSCFICPTSRFPSSRFGFQASSW